MTIKELKAWFAGYTEDMDRAPNYEQWQRIKAAIGDLDDNVMSGEEYLVRYGYFENPQWPSYISPNNTVTNENVGTEGIG